MAQSHPVSPFRCSTKIVDHPIADRRSPDRPITRSPDRRFAPIADQPNRRSPITRSPIADHPIADHPIADQPNRRSPITPIADRRSPDRRSTQSPINPNRRSPIADRRFRNQISAGFGARPVFCRHSRRIEAAGLHSRRSSKYE
jgi:hypothetical protein